MQEPCRSCDRKGIDFGGCRCQALQITGAPEATDPTCSKTPDRRIIDKIVAAGNLPMSEVQGSQWLYRIDAPVIRAQQ